MSLVSLLRSPLLCVTLLAALPVAAAELTFQQIALEVGSPPLPIYDSAVSPDGRNLYGLYAADVGGVVVYARDPGSIGSTSGTFGPRTRAMTIPG